jgi:hypothetical protein
MKTGHHTIARLKRLRAEVGTPGDVLLGAAIITWALVLRPLKYIVPLPVLIRALRRKPQATSRNLRKERQVVAFARWASRVTAFPSRGNCLERSLIAYRYLTALGANPTLVVGFGIGPNRDVRGHAWVVVDGQPVDDSDDALAGFEETMAFGPDGAPQPAASH